jgi:hypothetical protein
VQDGLDAMGDDQHRLVLKDLLNHLHVRSWNKKEEEKREAN